MALILLPKCKLTYIFFYKTFEILEVNPMLTDNYLEMSFVRAKSHIMRKEFEEAEEIYLDILSKFPKNDVALKELTCLKSLKKMSHFFFLNYI